MRYKVKLVSQTNAIVFIIVGSFAAAVSARTILPKGGLQHGGVSIFVVSVLGFIAYFSWQFFVTGRTVWTVNENMVEIIWTKRFFLVNIEDDIIKWSEIKDISRGSDSQYYNLKIELNSGYTINYFHDTLTTKDDFKEMIKVLYETLKDKKVAANNSVVNSGV